MNHTKRFLSLTAAAAMGLSLLTAFPAPAHAVLSDDVYTAGGYTSTERTLMRKIKETITGRKTTYLDISSYNVSLEDLKLLIAQVYFAEPEMFYLNHNKLSVKVQGLDHVIAYHPLYLYDEDTTAEMTARIEAQRDRITSIIDDDWTDVEKIIYIHDTLVSETEYHVSDDKAAGRDLYACLVDHKCVCVGYALAFEYFMDYFGIPNITVTSEDHIWNMVKVDGEWYFVDCTWDDLTDTSPNTVTHFTLLNNEDEYKAAAPENIPWDYALPSDSDKFTREYWHMSIARLAYLDGYWYYPLYGYLVKYSFRDGSFTSVADLPLEWRGEEGLWNLSFSKVQAYNGCIYYSTTDTIYRYDPKKNESTRVYSPKAENDYQIYDFAVESSGGRDVLTVYLSDDYMKTDKQVKRVSLKAEDGTSEKLDRGLSVRYADGIVNVSWDRQPGADGYYLYRYDRATKKISRIWSTSDGTRTSVRFKRTSRDNNCYYAIKVSNGGTLSAYSAWKAAK